MTFHRQLFDELDRELTNEEAELIGYQTDFRDRRGEPMYMRASGTRGTELRRVGATTHCIVCGLQGAGGVLAYAHIHMRDLHLSPEGDEQRVFRLCWHHHHGCYDQGYLSTTELLRAEAIWIGNKDRPTPHARDVILMKRAMTGEVVRHCVWTEKRVDRRATFNLDRFAQAIQIDLFE